MQMQTFNQEAEQKVISRTLFLEQKNMKKNKISLQPVTNLAPDYTVGAKVNSSGAFVYTPRAIGLHFRSTKINKDSLFKKVLWSKYIERYNI